MSTASQRLYSVPKVGARADSTRASGEGSRVSAEPSMEEILASIRRIIADDQAHAAPLPGESLAADTGVSASAITFDDDVLQADDPLPDDPLLDEEAPAPARAEAAPARARQDPPQRTPARQPAKAAPEAPAAPEPPVAETALPEPPATAGHREADTAERLLSSAADASAASAFQALSSVVVNRSPRTLDDLVQEMLRPLLKAWLDEKLPPLVEKLVQAEIERISRGGR